MEETSVLSDIPLVTVDLRELEHGEGDDQVSPWAARRSNRIRVWPTGAHSK
ncbi:hypothetical protein ACQPXB_30395 [Amycolatopsis sp. CA-161197]|uniref:hypothetical protein n=1 Tax=unclassified Amycolatopsis TaxID=2618356 RepID=UPI00369F101D